MAQGWLCLAPAAAWIRPADRVMGAEGLRSVLIRWGHAVAWLLLAAMCLLRGRPPLVAWGGPVGLSSLVVELAFLATTFVLK